jgi:hypothetical protein
MDLVFALWELSIIDPEDICETSRTRVLAAVSAIFLAASHEKTQNHRGFGLLVMGCWL